MTLRAPVEVRITGKGSEITVGCDLDFEHAEQLLQAVEQCSKGPVTLDMSRVRFMDSTGVQTLVTALRTLEERGLPIRSVRVCPSVFEILELVGCVDIFGRHVFSVEA